jgi:hypothetical protein
MATRPLTISMKHLSESVDQAVKLVSKKHKVRFSPEFRIGPGTIMGRQLLQADIPLKQAWQIAAEITQHVISVASAEQAAMGGVALEPAVFVGRGMTLCGMIAGPVWEIR